MFESLLERLVEQGGSVRAYEACVRDARARIVEEPNMAAALFIIATAAQRFVDSFDDQPLTVKAASEELAEFRAILTQLDAAYSKGTDSDRLEALNSVSLRLGTATPQT